jgi:hypothetical protein
MANSPTTGTFPIDCVNITWLRIANSNEHCFALRQIDETVMRLQRTAEDREADYEAGGQKVEESVSLRHACSCLSIPLYPATHEEIVELKRANAIGCRAPCASLIIGSDLVRVLATFGRRTFSNLIQNELIAIGDATIQEGHSGTLTGRSPSDNPKKKKADDHSEVVTTTRNKIVVTKRVSVASTTPASLPPPTTLSYTPSNSGTTSSRRSGVTTAPPAGSTKAKYPPTPVYYEEDLTPVQTSKRHRSTRSSTAAAAAAATVIAAYPISPQPGTPTTPTDHYNTHSTPLNNYSPDMSNQLHSTSSIHHSNINSNLPPSLNINMNQFQPGSHSQHTTMSTTASTHLPPSNNFNSFHAAHSPIAPYPIPVGASNQPHSIAGAPTNGSIPSHSNTVPQSPQQGQTHLGRVPSSGAGLLGSGGTLTINPHFLSTSAQINSLYGAVDSSLTNPSTGSQLPNTTSNLRITVDEAAMRQPLAIQGSGTVIAGQPSSLHLLATPNNKNPSPNANVLNNFSGSAPITTNHPTTNTSGLSTNPQLQLTLTNNHNGNNPPSNVVSTQHSVNNNSHNTQNPNPSQQPTSTQQPSNPLPTGNSSNIPLPTILLSNPSSMPSIQLQSAVTQLSRLATIGPPPTSSAPTTTTSASIGTSSAANTSPPPTLAPSANPHTPAKSVQNGNTNGQSNIQQWSGLQLHQTFSYNNRDNFNSLASNNNGFVISGSLPSHQPTATSTFNPPASTLTAISSFPVLQRQATGVATTQPSQSQHGNLPAQRAPLPLAFQHTNSYHQSLHQHTNNPAIIAGAPKVDPVLTTVATGVPRPNSAFTGVIAGQPIHYSTSGQVHGNASFNIPQRAQFQRTGSTLRTTHTIGTNTPSTTKSGTNLVHSASQVASSSHETSPFQQASPADASRNKSTALKTDFALVSNTPHDQSPTLLTVDVTSHGTSSLHSFRAHTQQPTTLSITPSALPTSLYKR